MPQYVTSIYCSKEWISFISRIPTLYHAIRYLPYQKQSKSLNVFLSKAIILPIWFRYLRIFAQLNWAFLNCGRKGGILSKNIIINLPGENTVWHSVLWSDCTRDVSAGIRIVLRSGAISRSRTRMRERERKRQRWRRGGGQRTKWIIRVSICIVRWGLTAWLTWIVGAHSKQRK